MNTPVDEFEFFLEKEWSDGLPVVTPTEERIARMLQGTRRDPDEVIGRIPPALETATVRTVAIHAFRYLRRLLYDLRAHFDTARESDGAVYFARDLLDVHIRGRSDLAADGEQAVRAERLDSYARLRIKLEICVEDRI